MTKTYLVTGGAGFIGSHLTASLLEDGHHVRILDDLSTGKRGNVPASVEFIVGSVADASLVKHSMQGVAGCFHLAAIASVARCQEDWIASHQVNLTGTITIFNEAKSSAKPIPVVYASSAAVFGDTATVPLTENSAANPLSAYGADKYGCELHARAAAIAYGSSTTGLRFFNVFGPRQDPKSPYSGVISIFCDRIKAGLPITIYGDGQQTRDFIFVADVVTALRRSMEKQKPKTALLYNVCAGREITVLELAQTIGNLLQCKLQINFAPERAGDIKRSLGDPTKLKNELEFDFFCSLSDGLRQTLIDP